jgi:hypothetical protein
MSEKLVKLKIKEALDSRGWDSWPIPQNGYGVSGVSDRIALRDGVFMAIEAKLHPNKPTPGQKKFLRQVRSQQCLSFVVSDKTIDAFIAFLDAFDRAQDCAMRNKDADEKDKDILVTSTRILIAPFMEES